MRRPRATRRPRSAHRRATRGARRAGRIFAFLLLAVVVLVTLLVTAFGAAQPTAVAVTRPALAERLVPAGPPRPQVIALHGSLRVQLPVPQERVTAIGYHSTGNGALPLDPVGQQANLGLFSRIFRRIFGRGGGQLRYYQLGGQGPANTTLDVGAPPGTEVYAPVDGTVVSVTDHVISGRRYGARIDLQPTNLPSVIVSLTHVEPDPALSVGFPVAAGTTKVGTLLDLAKVERQVLARYTQDAGNHVALEVHPAATLSIR